MQGLNLYAQIEEFLGFDDEFEALHNTFKEIIEELNPKTLIDIGCGKGGFMELLNRLDIQTFGIDLSSFQIELCHQKQLNAKCIDLCKVDTKFDCATAISDVINYIPKKNIRSFFNCVFKVLNKDGYFIFDINTLYGFEEVAQGSLNIDLEDKFISIDAIYEDKILETNITLFNKIDDLYKKDISSIKQYYHLEKFLTKELKLCGFELQSAMKFKLHDDHTTLDNFDKQIFIAQKIN